VAAFLLILLAGMVASPARADFSLVTAGAAVAPIDADAAKKDPFVSLSASQRRDIVREFKALLSMGTQQASSSHWVGNDIADCQTNATAQDSFCRKCDVQMGSSHAEYLFYNAGPQCRLRDVNVIVESGDMALLKELKPSARYYAGSRDGQFYLDEDEHSGQSSLRFVWKRVLN
jgi:hypothetical protein